MQDNPIEVTKFWFKQTYKKEAEYFFVSNGRFEIIGNHTDHNHGKCLAAAAYSETYCAVSPRNDDVIHFVSHGFGECEISLNSLEHIPGDTSFIEVIKGVIKYFGDNGYKIGGFDACCYSCMRSGSGLSSSAAFELLIGQIINELFNDNKASKIFMSKAGQYSENNYYEKNSGLLDQIAAAYGNVVYIDFENINEPKIEQLEFPFKDLHIVIIYTNGSHDGLNDLYSSIPNDMYNAARKAGHNFLRETSLEEVLSAKGLTEMELNRAKHFFGENERVDAAYKAMKQNDEESFLKAINESRISSTNYLKNMMIGDNYEDSPLQACNRAMEFLGKNGACKINGGGFAGSIICFVKDKHYLDFMKKMFEYYTQHNVVEISIEEKGPHKE